METYTVLIALIALLFILILIFALAWFHNPIYSCTYIPRLAVLTANFQAIKQEAVTLSQRITRLKPRPKHIWSEQDYFWKQYFTYLESNRGWSIGYLDTEDWLNFPILAQGRTFANAADCPLTYSVLEQIGGVNMAGFALLKSGGELRQHVDSVGRRYGTLACNFGLQGNGSYLHIDKRSIKQEEGKILLFDSTHPHSVTNYGGDRLILYLDIDISH